MSPLADEKETTVALDERALAQYRARIQRHIRAMVRDADEAEELTQETFVRALAGAASLRDPQATLAWLYRIATNVSLDHLRRRRARSARLEAKAVSEEEVGASEEGTPSSIEFPLEQMEMSACVQRVLGTLPDTYRVALLLHDGHGLSNPEIAELLGCSLATVKIRVHRARKRLREAFDTACVVASDERGVLVCEAQRPDARLPGCPDAERVEIGG
jgi:RNA polymerase sigma-70 factor (ECF subfamily)